MLLPTSSRAPSLRILGPSQSEKAGLLGRPGSRQHSVEMRSLDGGEDGDHEHPGGGSRLGYLRPVLPLLLVLGTANALLTAGSSLTGTMPSSDNDKELPTYIMIVGNAMSFVGNGARVRVRRLGWCLRTGAGFGWGLVGRPPPPRMEVSALLPFLRVVRVCLRKRAETIIALHCLTTSRRVLAWGLVPILTFAFIFVYAKTRFWLNDPLAIVVVGMLAYANAFSNGVCNPYLHRPLPPALQCVCQLVACRTQVACRGQLLTPHRAVGAVDSRVARGMCACAVVPRVEYVFALRSACNSCLYVRA